MTLVIERDLKDWREGWTSTNEKCIPTRENIDTRQKWELVEYDKNCRRRVSV